MRRLFWFLLLCHLSSAVKHSLKYFITASSGLTNFPEFVAVGFVDDVAVGSCDSDKTTPEAKQDWVIKLFLNDPQQFEFYNQQCLVTLPNFFKGTIHTLTQRFNQSGGVHVLQNMNGCEWDDETGEMNGFNQFGYDGEDFMSFDLKTLTWVALKPQAVSTKLYWDANRATIKRLENELTQIYPQWLKTCLAYGESSLLRTVVGVVVGLLLLILCISGLLMWRRNRTGFRPAETQPPPAPDDDSETTLRRL